MDRKLILATLMLLFVQIALLVADVDVYFFADQDDSDLNTQNEIGVVLNKKQNVKRRGHNSIVWEDSEQSDKLLVYDSVLTLENSSAQIQLKDDVNINLHENTLIVLEPPDSDKSDSLRIRFSHGDFLSRTQRQRLQVGSGDWQIEAKPGTDFTLKTIEGDQVEVEVVRGELDVGSKKLNGKMQVIEKGTRFTLSKNEISNEQKISSDLKFLTRAEERIYSHSFPTPFMLHWQGEADSIRVVGPDKKAQLIDVAKTSQYQFALYAGTHYLSLVQKNKISSEIILKALHAPKLRYTSPLPRDRFELSQTVLFSWSPAEGVMTYELELTSAQGGREKAPAKINLIKMAPQLEDELQMRVWGYDEAGFRIPPYYSQPLFILRDPLAPPKLLTPKTNDSHNPSEERQPASPEKQNDDSAQFKKITDQVFAVLKVLFSYPMAYADEFIRKVTFAWQVVPGADFYNIEISSDKDFQNPEVITKVFDTSFTWSHYKKKIYYWRVAAGSHSGRMGLFSETASVDLANIDSLQAGEIAPGVKLVKSKITKATAQQVVQTAPLATDQLSTAPPVVESPIQVTPNDPPEDKSQWTENGLWQNTTYLYAYHLSYSHDGEFKASLEGFADFAFSHAVNYTFRSRDELNVHAHYTAVSWEPDDKNDLPYQKSFSTPEYGFNALYKKFEREISFGFSMTSLTTLKRTALESVTDESSILFGPSLGLNAVISKELIYFGRAALLYGNQLGAAQSENSLNYQLDTFQVGGDMNFLIFFGPKSLSGFNLQSGLHFGYSW